MSMVLGAVTLNNSLLLLLIHVLFVSLIALCVSCRKKRLKENRNGDSSKQDSSGHQNGGTPLHQFNNCDTPTTPAGTEVLNSSDPLNSSRLKSSTLNRALPDIPISSASQSFGGKNHANGSVKVSNLKKASPVKRSKKCRAPQPPTSNQNISTPVVSTGTTSTSTPSSPNVTSDGESPATATPQLNHHPYAVIKEPTLDSSGNDTDDYCDPQLCSTSIESKRGIVESPSVTEHTSSRNSGLLNSASTSAGYAVAGRVPSAEIPYMTPPTARNPNTIDPLTVNFDTHSEGGSSEISYNKISVREPLAKVLAERAILEHQYIEMDDERVSSFYEEIAGSAASSVTYTKIGDIVDGAPVSQSNDEGSVPEPPSLQSLYVAAENSRSGSPLAPNGLERGSALECLYSVVDKSSKAANRQKFLSADLEGLYAKVQKPSTSRHSTGHSSIPSHPYAISPVPPPVNSPTTNSVSTVPAPLPSTPPPLPPLPSVMNMSRSSRTLSLYANAAPSRLSAPGPASHQRSLSSGNAGYMYSGPEATDLAIEEPGYEVVGKEGSGSDVEPCYEQIRRHSIHEARRNKPPLEDVPSDPGYEVVHFSDVENDPGYETISKRYVSRHNSELSEPAYEVIKRLPHNNSGRPGYCVRNESDASADPGYERVLYVPRTYPDNHSRVDRNDNNSESHFIEHL